MKSGFFPAIVLAFLCATASVAPIAARGLTEIAEQGRSEARSALSALRDFRLQVQSEQLPLEQEIRSLRQELEQARNELRKLREAGDSNDVALADLEKQVERAALARSTAETLIDELINEQSRAVHNRLDPEFDAQFRKWMVMPDGSAGISESAPLLARMVRHLNDFIGGGTVPLTIYSVEGRKIQGTGLFIGPLVYFDNGDQIGIVDTSDPSFPRLIPASPSESQKIRNAIRNRAGLLPVDATGGAALAIRKSSPDLLGEIVRAGIWIYPILLAAAVALVVGSIKWISLARTRRAVQKAQSRYPEIWHSLDGKKQARFLQRQPALLRPFWETLWNTRDAAPDSREDLLYARLIEIRLRLTRGLAALSVIAATAPLLGLLGTVTGMITTFQRITLFGTGDPQNLSGGISEALLTTKFGLIVAIPTFLLYAYLSRRAQGTVAQLESFSRRFEKPSPKESSEP